MNSKNKINKFSGGLPIPPPGGLPDIPGASS